MASLLHTPKLLFQPHEVHHIALKEHTIFLQHLPASKVLFSKKLDASQNVSFFSLSHGFTAAHCKAPVSATKSVQLCQAKMCHFSATFASSLRAFFKARTKQLTDQQLLILLPKDRL